MGLAGLADPAIFGLMAKAWNIVARTKPMDGKPGQTRYYIVAMASKETALAALRSHSDLASARLEVAGETSADFMDWAGGVKDGQVLCVVAME